MDLGPNGVTTPTPLWRFKLNRFFIVLQHCLPQHLLSRVVGKLAACEISALKNILIRLFMSRFAISLAEAKRKKVDEYTSFNDFFCRALEDGARPIDANQNSICSPADGAFSQLGKIEHGRIFQAKGQSYSAAELLADNDAADIYTDGEFATIYLSPKDYHRVHMPFSGTLKKMSFVPGDLFSVNQVTAENVERLFSRNERLVCHFETEHGPMALVLVGAMIVASIETVWAGCVARPGKEVKHTHYVQGMQLNKGHEMGRFKLGSTAIVLFPKDTIRWNSNLSPNSPTRMGEKIGELLTN